MKKVKLYPALVLSFILSSFSVTSSALEETFTYGSQPATWSGVPLTGGIWAPVTTSNTGAGSYTPPEARAAIAAGQKAQAEGQRAYCKANNYPTVVPFCGGYKEQEKKRQECIAKAQAATTACNNAYSTLNTICSAASALIGRGAGWAASKLIGDQKLIEIAKSAGAFAGVEADIMTGSCSGFHERALNGCAGGGAKMQAQCN